MTTETQTSLVNPNAAADPEPKDTEAPAEETTETAEGGEAETEG